jgi:hypothetical protein
VPDNEDTHANAESAITVKKESHVIPRTRVGRKSGKGRSHEESPDVSSNGAVPSESLKQMLRENIFNKNGIDRNNNTGNMMSGEAGPSLLLNSPAFMSMLPLMLMNQSQFTGIPDPTSCMPDATSNYTATANPFNQPATNHLMAQSNHNQALTASMLSTLDPAAISAIAPLICSYLFNFERLVLASTAASAASASLSATASTLSAANPKSTVPGSAFPAEYGSFPPTDPFLLDYVQRLRTGTAPAEPSLSDLVSPAQKRRRQESSDGPDDASADIDGEDGLDECDNQGEGSAHQTLLNGSLTDYNNDTDNKKVDPVILKIPSFKSKKSSTKCNDHGMKLPDLKGLDGCSLLERNLMSLSSNHSNSYASSVNSEESGCEQSVLSGEKKGSRTTGIPNKRVNGCKKSSDGSCDSSAMKNRPKRGRYRNYDREALDKAVAAVQSGEMSVHRAGTHYGVPHR